MITRKKTTLFVLSTLTFSGLVLAQEESSSGDAEVFMQSDGQEEFIEYRLEDGMNGPAKGLNGDDADDGFYVDYVEKSTDTVSDSETEVVDMLDDYADSDKSATDYDNYDVYGSGIEGDQPNSLEREVAELEAFDPEDEDEANQEFFYDYEEEGGKLMSFFGVEDNEGHHSRGVQEPAAPSFKSVLEVEADILRKVKKKKKKKRKKKRKGDDVPYFYGAIDVFKLGDDVSRSNRIPGNCERGWHTDHKSCGNACRMEFLRAGGRESRLENARLFYGGNPKYTRCEACAVWSWYTPTTDNFQKLIGSLRKPTVSFCDINNKNETLAGRCLLRERRFMACMGTAVCSKECWSKSSTPELCEACRGEFCQSREDEKKGKKKNQFQENFLLCRQFDGCKARYPPNKYRLSPPAMQYGGKAKCWGSALDEDRWQDIDPVDDFDTKQMCDNARYPKTDLSFPEWNRFYKNCTTFRCDVDSNKKHTKMCVDLKCKASCWRGNGYSEECLNCGPCKACPVKSMMKIGNFDRKKWNLLKQKFNPLVKQAGTYRPKKRDQLQRSALEPLTDFLRSQLNKGKCSMCDQHNYVLECRDACTVYQKLRVKGRTTKHEHNMYALTMEACTSTTCTKGFNDRCAVCMDRAEKFSKIQWGNMLGNSFFKENYDGWGCALDCKPKQISALGEYRGVNIFDPAYANITRAFDNVLWDIMDDETVHELRQWKEMYKEQKRYNKKYRSSYNAVY